MPSVIIGDIHGCAQELEELLRINRLDKGHRIYVVGDVVAKGPDSQGAIDLLRSLGASGVRGNHDERLIRWWESLGQGGNQGQDPRQKPEPVRLSTGQERVARSLSKEAFEWLAGLPLWLELPEENALLVHGGLMPGLSLEEQEPDLLLNLRSIDDAGRPSKRAAGGRPWASLWQGPEHVYFGHDAKRGLQIYPWATGLDTGCVYGGRLSAVILPERRLVSVPAKKAWAPIG